MTEAFVANKVLLGISAVAFFAFRLVLDKGDVVGAEAVGTGAWAAALVEVGVVAAAAAAAVVAVVEGVDVAVGADGGCGASGRAAGVAEVAA